MVLRFHFKGDLRLQELLLQLLERISPFTVLKRFELNWLDTLEADTLHCTELLLL